MRIGVAAITSLCAALATAAATAAPLTGASEPMAVGHGSESPRDRARKLANRAFELYQKGSYEEANALFREADETFHAPTLVVMVGRSYVKIGKLADAEAAFQKTADEALPATAPPEFRKAQQEARAELAALQAQVPRLVLSFADPADARRAEVTIDGTEIEPSELDRPVSVNPGEHTVEVRADGARPFTHTATWVAGHVERIEVASLTPPAPTQPTGAEDAGSTSTGMLAGGLVTLGIGVGGLVMGIVTGAMALDAQSELEERCPDRWCLPEDEELARSADRNAVLSTVGLVVGGAAAGVGTILLVVAGTSSDEEPATPTAALRVGPGTAVLVGRF